MSRLVLAVVLLAVVAAARAQGQLPVVELGAGMHLIRAELAADTPSRMRGLMFRKALAPNHGMLFVFDERAPHCMWMKNTDLPLSVAFVGDDGRVLNIEDMAPHTETPHCATGPARFALEMARGWFRERGLGAGTQLRGLPAARR